MTVSKPKHFSMIRSFALADFLTLGNGICGTSSILCVAKYLVSNDSAYLYAVFGLLPASLFFDIFDGRVARMQKKQSLLGQELDSLADLVSFGVAPATLAFAVGLRGGWDAAILVYFVCCGLARLARFNATAAELADEGGKVKYFEGTPIPSSLLLVTMLGFFVKSGRFGDQIPLGAMAVGPFTLHPLALVFFLSGCAMISKSLRIPKP